MSVPPLSRSLVRSENVQDLSPI